MRTKAMRSRWLASMLACTLNTTPQKASSSGCTGLDHRLLVDLQRADARSRAGAPGPPARPALPSHQSCSRRSQRTRASACPPERLRGPTRAMRRWPVPCSPCAVVNSWPKRLRSGRPRSSGIASKSCGRRSLPDSNTVMVCVRRLMMPPKLLPWPTGQVMGTQGMPSSRSISSRMSSGSRTSRSILLTKVMMGVSRWRQTSIRRRVCASTPLAASITISAESTAVSTR